MKMVPFTSVRQRNTMTKTVNTFATKKVETWENVKSLTIHHLYTALIVKNYMEKRNVLLLVSKSQKMTVTTMQ